MGKRLITLSDGTSMGDELSVFKTNAPVEELKKLEDESCKVYLNGGNDEDVPIWANVLANKGYVFEFVTSTKWLKKNYSQITEHYTIENQPELV